MAKVVASQLKSARVRGRIPVDPAVNECYAVGKKMPH